MLKSSNAGALMRVNHVGEVCAQALYTAQAAGHPRRRRCARHFEAAAREETDHLAWTADRLDELGARPSLLNPLWYAGAFGMGLVAGRLGDRVSLGSWWKPSGRSRPICKATWSACPRATTPHAPSWRRCSDDEARHAAQAQGAGALELPAPVKALMRAAAKVMTTTAHYI